MGASTDSTVAAILAQFDFDVGPRSGADFQRPNEVLEWKRGLQSVRDLHGAALQLAIYGQGADIARSSLLLLDPALSRERLQKEWEAVRRVLRADLSKRLTLVAIDDAGVLTVPADAELREIGELIAAAVAGEPSAPSSASSFHEIAKLLLVRWLRKRPAARIQELQAEAGLSYPTVAKAVRRLGKHIRQLSNRSIELASFPREAWAELRVLAPRLRGSKYFWDRSGQRPDPEDLLTRLRRLHPERIAVGGVLAARHWDPELDVAGLPRLDLCAHAGHGPVDLGFVRRVDPALEEIGAVERASPVLAIHFLQRPVAHFEDVSGAMPWADPVETMLDLHDLRFDRQAEELLQRLRKVA